MNWKERSKKYNNTNWVKDTFLLEEFFKNITKKNYNNVLEIGIGTGIVAEYFLNNFKCKNYYGIDYSQDMLNQIKNENIIKKNVDCRNLPFENNSQDLIIMRNVFHYLDYETKNNTLSEINRCLTPNGIFILSQIIPFEEVISIEYDNLIGRNIHYYTESEIETIISNKLNILNKYSIISKQNSISNWASSSNQDIEKIINKHKMLSNRFKNIISYHETLDDIYVNIKHIIIYSNKL